VTALSIPEVKRGLKLLGYYDGPIDDDYMEPAFRADLRRFQRDYPKTGTPDGWYGQRTEAALLPLERLVTKTLSFSASESCRRWHLTYYYVGNVRAWSPLNMTPMRTPAGVTIAMVPAHAFVEAALEGTTRLANGQLANVAQPAYSPVVDAEYRGVFDIAKRNNWIPSRAGYAGIQLDSTGQRVTHARNFELRAAGPGGWPIEHGIEMAPFKTLAADIGVLGKHDPQFKGRGGVVPIGTKVWILELVGKELPDGSEHDGWCTVNDTGGGIYGAHFDMFTGSRRAGDAAQIPARAHIWFDGIERKLPMSYGYGL
jgi:hypothetical protein